MKKEKLWSGWDIWMNIPDNDVENKTFKKEWINIANIKKAIKEIRFDIEKSLPKTQKGKMCKSFQHLALDRLELKLGLTKRGL